MALLLAAWQRGYPLPTGCVRGALRQLQPLAQGDRGDFGKNDIAEALSKGEIHALGGGAVVQRSVSKARSDITMFPGMPIGRKLRGDVHVRKLGYATADDRRTIVRALREDPEYALAPVWLTTHAESSEDEAVATAAGFGRVGTKFTSTAEVYAVWFRPPCDAPARAHPPVDPLELVALHRLPGLDFGAAARQIADRLATLGLEFTNHYSNYNKRRSWGALSLRGFAASPRVIEKPSEMPEKWRAEHRATPFRLQDTRLMEAFPSVRAILERLGGAVERVRLMRLKPGDGELARHTDQVDAEVGVSDGRIMRIHVPIVTNRRVRFTAWGADGTAQEVHMRRGEAWYLDIRKPHRAVNGGEEERIHLVVDVVASPDTRRLLVG